MKRNFSDLSDFFLPINEIYQWKLGNWKHKLRRFSLQKVAEQGIGVFQTFLSIKIQMIFWKIDLKLRQTVHMSGTTWVNEQNYSLIFIFIIIIFIYRPVLDRHEIKQQLAAERRKQNYSSPLNLDLMLILYVSLQLFTARLHVFSVLKLFK